MSKKSDFFRQLDNSVWGFVQQLDRTDLSGLELTQGTGWSRYLLKNQACSIAVVTMQDGILLSAWTDLNPTVGSWIIIRIRNRMIRMQLSPAFWNSCHRSGQIR